MNIPKIIAPVNADLSVTSFSILKLSLLFKTANIIDPSAPTPAASVGVAKPANIDPKTIIAQDNKIKYDFFCFEGQHTWSTTLKMRFDDMTECGICYKRAKQTSLPEWVIRYAKYIQNHGVVLDLACGAGRHTRYMLALSHPVVAIDIDISKLSDISNIRNLYILEYNLEESAWPLGDK